MKFANYAPPIEPSREEQKDALQKGLGRAVLWAKSNRLSSEFLLDACVHDYRYDWQVESGRGEWLWELLTTSRQQDDLRETIYRALTVDFQEDDSHQLCELAFHYADAGDDRFCRRLCEIVEQVPFPQIEWLGEDQILDLLGKEGFQLAARLRGEQLRSRSWDYLDERLADSAIEKWGREQIEGWLDSWADEPLRTYREAWKVQLAEKNGSAAPTGQNRYQARMKGITLDEIFNQVQTAKAPGMNLRGWGMYADLPDLELVYQKLIRANTTVEISNLLRIFSNRPLPRVESILIELCSHPDREIRRRTTSALAMNTHPLIREFLEEQFGRGIREGGVVSMFERNYRPGDESRILEALVLPENIDDLHGLLFDVIDVLNANEQADPAELGVMAYALTPCSQCRLRIAECITEGGDNPRWLFEECQFDVEQDTRLLVMPA